MDNKIIIDGVDVSECEQIFAQKKCALLDQVYCEDNPDCYYKQLKRAKAEIKKYEDMAKKGLEEFKDVGGCWGCGLQLQLNQDMEDIKKLKTENERLKKEVETWNYQADKRAELSNIWFNTAEKYKQALQEIREILKEHIVCDDCNFEGTDKCDARMCTHFYLNYFSEEICDKINSVIGAE